MPDSEFLATRLADSLTEQGYKIAVAESCTGGWLAKICTDLAGSSQWFERGFVTYSNEAKQELLGVKAGTLNQYGAVSEAVVLEMVQGAIFNSRADLVVAISGIAGPGGGTEDKPVGTVWIAWMRSDEAPRAATYLFAGDRNSVRKQAVYEALKGLLELA